MISRMPFEEFADRCDIPWGKGDCAGSFGPQNTSSRLADKN